MGKINLIIVVLMALIVGGSLSSLHNSLSKITDSLDHSLLNMQTELLGAYALSYGMLKLQEGDVIIGDEEQTWNTPHFAVCMGDIDSICYTPMSGDTIEVIPYIKNWQTGNSIASSSRALIDFFITQPEDQFGYYGMEDGSGTTLSDLSGAGNNGSLINMDDSNWVDGFFGSGLIFDGDEDYADLGTDIAQSYDDMLTVGGWIQMVETSNVDWGNIITGNSDDQGNQLEGFTLSVKAKYVGHPYLEFYFDVVTLSGKEGVSLKVYDPAIDVHAWHYVVGMLNMQEQKIMVGIVDINLWAIEDINAQGMPSMADTGVITVGHIVGAPNGQGRKSGMSGKLDSIRVIADVMTFDQLIQLMTYDGVKMPKIVDWKI